MCGLPGLEESDTHVICNADGLLFTFFIPIIVVRVPDIQSWYLVGSKQSYAAEAFSNIANDDDIRQNINRIKSDPFIQHT